MRTPLGLLAFVLLAVAGFWFWLGKPVPMPASPLAPGEKLYCVSYAPFRPDESPLDPTTQVTPAEIEDDLTRLAAITGCVRTYSTEFGLDQVAPIAARHGLKVMQGLWLSSDAAKNAREVETVVGLAKSYPETIQAVVVGNEVLLRGEMSAVNLGATIRSVKARIGGIPVTYADVWEFWLRNRELAADVDFVTIHILPYWEDFPIAATEAAAHVDSIHRRVADAFPGKDILIGETGWPSRGRMREGALPSPSNEARVMHDVLALAAQTHYRVNLIESFDQPWKRYLEGTVGGYWGLLDSYRRVPKFTFGQPVSDHPLWPWQAAGGMAFALLIFAAAGRGRRRAKQADLPLAAWIAVAACALAGGTLIGWAVENAAIESLGISGTIRCWALAAAALLAPPVAAAGITAAVPVPGFAAMLGRPEDRPSDVLAWLLGAVLILVVVLTVQTALGLVFDPRYRDFPFAALGAAVVPLLALQALRPRPAGRRGLAERMAAAVLALSAVYIFFNESPANWQAVCFSAVALALAFTLLRLRDAPG